MESVRGGEQGTGRQRRREGARGARRPDQAIYVPLALRQRTPAKGEAQSHHAAHGGSTSTTSSSSSSSDYPSTELAESDGGSMVSSCCSLSYSASEESCFDATLDGSLPPAHSTDWHDPLPMRLPRPLDDELRCRELFGEPSASDQAWDQALSYLTGMRLEDGPGEEEEEEEEEEDVSAQSCSSVGAPPSTAASNSRDSDAGDFTQEIITKLTEEDITIEHAKGDYSAYQNMWLNEEEFNHVIEIYGFPNMFKTDDLLDAFSNYSGGGMKIKWVDNTHALGVFSSEAAAAKALSIRHPLLKTRPLSQASKQAKGKAIRRAEFIQPVKERPRTDTAVARRMVTRALGLQRGGSRGKRC